jgi:putative ABC transport system permease protein
MRAVRPPMTLLIAWRNLAHDHVRFATTLLGVIFAVTLMSVQIGLLLGFSATATGLVEHTSADIWLASRGIANVDQSVILPQRSVYQALETLGVAAVSRYIVRYADWRKPDGGTELVIVVGFDMHTDVGAPWNLIEGSIEDLNRPNAAIIDRLYLSKLGISETGGTAEIRGRLVRVVGLTSGIRTFTQAPYVFTSYDNALDYTDVGDGETSFVLVRIQPDRSVAQVVQRLREALPDLDVMARRELSDRTRNYWLYTTGAGGALAVGFLLGAVVGVTIVAQTLYAATTERILEYATLRAIGAPTRYLISIVVLQAVVSGAIGCAVGLTISYGIVRLSQDGPAFLQLPFEVGASLALFTILMCVAASVLAMRKVTAIDPTSVFR